MSAERVDQKEIVFFGHGVLTLPLIVILPFGLLGLRHGQLFDRISGCVIDLMFFFNYGLILAVAVSRFVNMKDYFPTIDKFFTGFVVFMTIKFTLLTYIFFKKSNFVCLLGNITKIRKYSLSKKEFIFLLFIFITVVTMVIYLVYYTSIFFVLPALRTGYRPIDFAFKSNSPPNS